MVVRVLCLVQECCYTFDKVLRVLIHCYAVARVETSVLS